MNVYILREAFNEAICYKGCFFFSLGVQEYKGI